MTESYWIAALLGVVEGVTEFLPVSSTGHLIVVGDVLGFQSPPGRSFEVMIQLGAICALLVFYARKLLGYAFTMHKSVVSRNMALALSLGVVPAIVLGALFHSAIKSVLYTPTHVAIALIIGGVIMLIVERFAYKPKIYAVEVIGWKRALLIGCAQAVALIPGVSRSGATIIGGVLCGLNKRTAAEFSFMLSIPIMSAAFLYDAYKNWAVLNWEHSTLIAIGFCTAFISAVLIVRPFLAIIGTIGFLPFALYRIVLGSIILYFL